jgi:hypothetical protein
MHDLIQALIIFSKYSDTKWPTHCEHDVLYIMGIGREQVTDEDHERLEILGFNWNANEDCYQSFRFGSS